MSIKGPLNNQSIDEIINNIENLLSTLQLNEAKELCEKLYKANSNNANVCDIYGLTLLQLNDVDNACIMFEKSCNLEPNSNFMKWLHYGQLKGGLIGVQSIEKGINILKNNSQQQHQQQQQQNLDVRAISSAYCAMIEIYMTDLCDEINAESECERLVQLAISSDPTSSEAYFILANLRLVQQRFDEARSAMSDCLKALSNEDIENEDVSQELLMNIAKACIELQDFDNALEVLNLSLQLDDTVGECWYLASMIAAKLNDAELFTNYAQGSQGKDVQIAPQQLNEIKQLQAALKTPNHTN